MPTKYGLVIGGALNLREQPSTSANRLALIPNETTLAITDHNDDWYTTTYLMFGFGRKLIHQFACMWIFCTSTYDCNDSLSAFRLLVAKMFLLNRILTMIGKVK